MIQFNVITSKVFNLKKGEEKTVFLLMGYSFFMGLAYAYFYSTSTTLILTKFDISILPYAYMTQGAVSYMVWLTYKRMEKYVVFSRLFTISGVFLLISVIGLSSGYLITESRWYAFALFVWYNIFLLLNGISFWGIATKIFDLRQAKRLFGLIGSGEILARVISFLSIPLLLTFMKPDRILYLSMGGIVVCLVLTPIIISNLSHKINIQKTVKVKTEKKRKGIGELIQNKYFSYIFILALFPLFATFYVDFMFLGQVKLQFTNATVINRFLGLFMGSMSVAEFFLKTFVSGRMLTKYGVLFGLLMLPFALAFSTTLAALYGTIYGVTGLFFSFIILSRLSIRVIRTIFFDPTFQILYQPIAIEDRLALQSKVEGVSKSIGFILAGALLVLLAKAKDLMIVHYNYIFIVIIALWIWVSYKLFAEYRGSLKSSLARLISTKDEVANETLMASFSGFVSDAGIDKTSITLNLTERTYPFISNLMMVRLLKKSTPALQRDILHRIANKGVPPAAGIIDLCLDENKPGAPIEQLLATQTLLLEKQAMDYKTINNMAASTDATDRLYVARLMAYYENYNNYKLLVQLLQDSSTRVRNAAIVAAGRLKKRELWPYVIDNLNNPQSAYAAAIAIKQIGVPIVNELITFFNRDNVAKDTQIRVIKLFAGLNGRPIMRLLKNNITLADDLTRKHIFSTMSKLQFQFPAAEMPLIKNFIEGDIDFIAWIVAAILDTEDADGTGFLQNGLKLELAGQKEFVFLQLSMMYDPKTIRFFIDGFDDATPESRAYALEVLDMTVPPDIKELFLPLLTELEYHELLEAYDNHFTQEQLPLKDRLMDIINKNYSRINAWNKACAIMLLIRYDGIEDLLLANVLNESALIGETALWAIYNKNPRALNEFSQRAFESDRLQISATVKYFEEIDHTRLLLFNVVNHLKLNSFFAELTEFNLVPVAQSASQIFVPAGTVLEVDSSDMENLFLVLQGSCEAHIANGLSLIAQHEMYWYIQSGPAIKQLSFTAKSDTVLLQVDSYIMFELLAEHLDLSKKIINVLATPNAG
jgi:AAA family ATP:ADP antiporter